jgi:phenylpyruvate tautomerase PptA (4-oxalocrotonate tautomerase family)
VVKGVEKVPDIPMFRRNTAAFVHEMAAGAIANGDGDGGYVRVQVLTNAGALDREKQIAVVSQLTDLVAEAANDPGLKKRTWVLLTEATIGGWGLRGHAHTNDELVGRLMPCTEMCRSIPHAKRHSGDGGLPDRRDLPFGAAGPRAEDAHRVFVRRVDPECPFGLGRRRDEQPAKPVM